MRFCFLAMPDNVCFFKSCGKTVTFVEVDFPDLDKTNSGAYPKTYKWYYNGK